MTRDEIIARIKAHEPAIRAEGVCHLALFGSRARGDAQADSDLDVVIDLDPGRKQRYSLLDLGKIYVLLEAVTGLAISLVDSAGASQDFLGRIAAHRVEVF